MVYSLLWVMQGLYHQQYLWRGGSRGAHLRRARALADELADADVERMITLLRWDVSQPLWMMFRCLHLGTIFKGLLETFLLRLRASQQLSYKSTLGSEVSISVKGHNWL